MGGNAQARKRIKAADFHYLAKFTAFASNDLVEEYYNKLLEKYPDGKMDKSDFEDTFKIAFPSRPEDKIEAHLTHIFNLFDQDGNKVICIGELMELMTVFIEIGEGKSHKVDLATTMAEMFHKSDKDKNDNLDLNEFIKGMLDHPVTSKILQMKKIDAILELM